jgi:hypothetical protein
MSPREMCREANRAIAMAQMIHTILGDLFDLPENGPGSKVEAAWDHMDVVLEALEEATIRAVVETGDWGLLATQSWSPEVSRA